MKNLLVVTAVIEFGTGLVLVLFPSLTAALLLGQPLDAAVGLTVARVAGVALLALGAACWFARLDGQAGAARGLVVAMTLYNAGIIVVFGHAAVALGVSGIGFLPVMVVHTSMAAWCAKCIISRRP
jgi:hypothetical protein